MKCSMLLLVVFFLIGCTSSKYRWGMDSIPGIENGSELAKGISGLSSDSTYGYTPSNPVQVGGGPVNQRKYLSMLMGLQEQELHFARIGSFGGFSVPVDGYEVSYDGLGKSVIIYIDMYTYNDPKAPVGFLVRPEYEINKSCQKR
ncbi:hypothetical protein CHISP_1243 [Chitinispirillum alkaliphilum]|nr:hypothetical protein CHISP_1243 [Chitinispirillum alkaliphilum]